MKKSAFILSLLILLNLTGNPAYSKSVTAVTDMSFPVKYICESVGGTITWDSNQKSAIVHYQDKTLILKIGSKTIISNGSKRVLDHEIKIIGGRTVLPVKIINEELGTVLSEQDCLAITAKKFLALVKGGYFDEASFLLSKTFSNYLTKSSMQHLAESLELLQLQDKKTEFWMDQVHQSFAMPVANSKNTFYTVKFDKEGKINELGIQEKQEDFSQAPLYADTNSFTETDVSFGNGIWKLPGKLTLPKGKGPFPVVILIHDSGWGDKDGSIGYLKPFRDLAQGLASNNIAVLRYDKRTLVHSSKMMLIGNVTLNEEIEQDVYAAAEFLKKDYRIDKNRIITLGYGLGGYVMPEIMKTGQDTFKAGIIMSGISRPQYEILPDYLDYLLQKGMANREQVEYVKEQVAILSSPGFNPKNPPDNYTMGNANYYGYMKNLNVLKTVEELNKPLLVIQGQRDFLVKADKDYKNWQKALEDNKRAEFKLYPGLSHLYTEGEGDSAPEEYFIKNNIPEYVIKDIADFIYRQK